MAVLQDPTNATYLANVEPGVGGLRVSPVPRGYGFTVAATTGTIAAALDANSSVFAMRLDPGTTKRAFIERIRLEFTTIVAFTTPVTAGRRLALFRGSGAAASGGTAIAAPVPKSSSASGVSEFGTAVGGDVRIASTGALTVTGITFETNPIDEFSLVHVGAAGAYREAIYEYGSSVCQPIQLDPGQLLAIRNPVAMDAAGTWQLAVNIDWFEAPLLTYTG